MLQIIYRVWGWCGYCVTPSMFSLRALLDMLMRQYLVEARWTQQADVRSQRAAEPTGNDDDCLRDQRLLLIYQNEMTKKGDMI